MDEFVRCLSIWNVAVVFSPSRALCEFEKRAAIVRTTEVLLKSLRLLMLLLLLQLLSCYQKPSLVSLVSIEMMVCLFNWRVGWNRINVLSSCLTANCYC